MYQQKEYINNQSIKEVKEKGFSVYNYISFRELIATVNKDYLQVLNLINIPFAIITGIVTYISFESNSFGLLILLFFGVYSCIFIYLFAKLIYRTYKFSKITNVIYTKKGIIIDGKIHNYNDDQRLKTLLGKLENLFTEYLSKPSNLKSVIKAEKEKLLSKLSNNFKVARSLNVVSSSRRTSKGGNFILVIYGALIAYSICVVLFYFIGMFFGFIFFLVIISLISLYFSINKSDEQKIKKEVIKIDDELLDLEKIYNNLNKKITTFSSGEIFDLSKDIEDEYDDFYKKISKIIDYKDDLKEMINSSSYKDFIDFSLFVTYLKNQFNKPINKMVNLLDDYEKKVIKELEEAKRVLQNTSSNQKYQIELKINNLEMIKKNITAHLSQLKMGIL